MPSSPSLPPQPLVPSYKMVVGVDYSEPSQAAIRAALDLALHRDAQIYAVTVAEGYGPGRPSLESEEMRQTFHDEAQRTLERWLGRELDELDQRGTKLNRRRIAATVDFGKPADAIIAMADDISADLVVVGTHGRKGIERLVMGSVAKDVLRRAPCPVLIVR
jgi:nucleotide-binding universal stress UspA family protein